MKSLHLLGGYCFYDARAASCETDQAKLCLPGGPSLDLAALGPVDTTSPFNQAHKGKTHKPRFYAPRTSQWPPDQHTLLLLVVSVYRQRRISPLEP